MIPGISEGEAFSFYPHTGQPANVPGIMHELLRSAPKAHVGIGFLPEKSLVHLRSPNNMQLSQ
jgi:hypothetical protein